MLTATATCSASALLKSIDQIGARTLPSGIKTHEQTGDKGQSECENEDGPLQRYFAFERNVLTSQSWNDRNRPNRQTQSNHAGDYAEQRTFEHEQSYDATPLGTQRHAQCDLAPASDETHQQ